MKKNLRFLLVAALATMFSTAAMAQDEQNDAAAAAPRVSANGSYQFKPSWGIGLQYGMTFTDLQNWNDYLLVPGHMNYFDVNWVAEHELYVEFTPVEGFRLSIFGGWQNLYITDTGFNYAYGGLEPAFSVRRSFFEFAVGAGVAYGYSWLDSDTYQMDGHGLLVRPFVEARFYIGEIFAIYLRVAFAYYKEFGLENPGENTYPGLMAKTAGAKIDTDKLQYAGPNAAVGFRFGNYAKPVVVIPDSDGDGVLDDIDDCPDVAGSEEFFGCSAPDTDGDAICDPWVAERGLGNSFAHICKGVDNCPDLAGADDVNGCPNPDVDADGICDPWVAEKGVSDRYANVCKGTDMCANEAEDYDGFKDDDGCADPDNDGDKVCDPWVSDKGLLDTYANVCKAKDACPDIAGYEQFNGCPAPDTDGDGYCDEWVYNSKLEAKFSCKGLDKCPNEKGTDENGCIPRRVVVTADKIEIKDKIFFATNKATIKKESDSLLEEIAQVLKDNKQIKKIEIQGHTDSSGNAKKNLKLSDDRAKSVRDRLVKLGVEADRLTYKGFGSTQMLIPLEKGQKKETKEQAAANRRVEFLILEQDTVTKEIDNPALKNK
jgi:outer membrane protein OmpA-like peptidoglycan-associated protein